MIGYYYEALVCSGPCRPKMLKRKKGDELMAVTIEQFLNRLSAFSNTLLDGSLVDRTARNSFNTSLWHVVHQRCCVSH